MPSLFDQIRVTAELHGFMDPMTKTSSSGQSDRTLLAALPASEFALTVHDGFHVVRMLPMHVKTAADASAALLVGFADLYPSPVVKVAAAALSERLEQLGSGAPQELIELRDMCLSDEAHALSSNVIPIDVAGDLWEPAGNLHKQSEASRSLELVSWPYEGGGGTTVSLRSVSDLQKAAEYFDTYAESMSGTDRRAFGLGLRKAAKAFGTDDYLSDTSRRYGATSPRLEGPNLLRSKVAEVYSRTSEESRKLAMELVDACAEAFQADGVDVQMLEKAAHALEELDQAVSLAGEVETRPFLWLFAPDNEGGLGKLSEVGVPKADNAADPIVYTSGQTQLRKSHFERARRLDLSSLKPILVNGAEVVEGLQGDDSVDVFTSLPAPQKRIIANFVEQNVKFRGAVWGVPGENGITYANSL